MRYCIEIVRRLVQPMQDLARIGQECDHAGHVRYQVAAYVLNWTNIGRRTVGAEPLRHV